MSLLGSVRAGMELVVYKKILTFWQTYFRYRYRLDRERNRDREQPRKHPAYLSGSLLYGLICLVRGSTVIRVSEAKRSQFMPFSAEKEKGPKKAHSRVAPHVSAKAQLLSSWQRV